MEEHSSIEIAALRKELERWPGYEFVVFNSRKPEGSGNFGLSGCGGAPVLNYHNPAAADALRSLVWGARYPVAKILAALPA